MTIPNVPNLQIEVLQEGTGDKETTAGKILQLYPALALPLQQAWRGTIASIIV